jgi:hypothetical protein
MTKPPDISDIDRECLRLGRGVLLTGLQHALQIIQTQIQMLETEAFVPASETAIRPAMARTLALIGASEPPKRGRPPKVPATLSRVRSRSGKGIKAYWAAMTPEERSTEVKRRKQLANPRGKPVAQPNHPRNKDHPKHKEWLATMKKAMRKSWGSLTPTVREEHIKAALAGRGVKRKQVPTVKLRKGA